MAATVGQNTAEPYTRSSRLLLYTGVSQVYIGQGVLTQEYTCKHVELGPRERARAMKYSFLLTYPPPQTKKKKKSFKAAKSFSDCAFN